MLLLQQGLLAFWFRVSPITSIHYSCEFSSRTGGFARYIIWTYAFLWISYALLCSFPFICILSVGFMIVSRNSVNAEYQQAIIIWAATSFPLILQSFPKALDLYQSEFSQNWRQLLTTSQNSKITSNSSNNLVRFVPIPIPTQCLSWFPKWRQCSVHVAKSKTKEFVLFTSRLDNTSSFAEVLALERKNVQVIQNVLHGGHDGCLSFVRVNISTSNRRVMIDFVNEVQGKEFAEQVASLFMA
ncbi:hypothetical protein BDR26DRAFT_864552 [Obelidium mucronatum]|nr:hypothetical protein BDR26DRAFT_864552 [Obelidium mucronatum]